MQIVIKISEDDYKEVKEDTYSGTPFENRVFSAIANGTPLEQIRDEISGKETAEEGIITGLDIAINVIKSMDMKQGAEQDI